MFFGSICEKCRQKDGVEKSFIFLILFVITPAVSFAKHDVTDGLPGHFQVRRALQN